MPASVPAWGPGYNPILYIVSESAPAAQESVLEHVLWRHGWGGEVVLGFARLNRLSKVNAVLQLLQLHTVANRDKTKRAVPLHGPR